MTSFMYIRPNTFWGPWWLGV